MGIFEGFGEFLGGIAESPIGQGIGQALGDVIRRRLGGGGGGGQGGPPVFIPVGVPAPAPTIGAGGVPFAQRPISLPTTGGAILPTSFPILPVQAGGSVMVPAPIPFFPDEPCPNFFRMPSAAGRARPVRFITAMNPTTGETTTWENVGRPILFSRDVATVRRVKKIAAGLQRQVGRKR